MCVRVKAGGQWGSLENNRKGDCSERGKEGLSVVENMLCMQEVQYLYLTSPTERIKYQMLGQPFETLANQNREY